MPAKPLCQVSECVRPGSKETSLSGSSMLFAFGMRISSSGWHICSRMTRLAIQSVSTKASVSLSNTLAQPDTIATGVSRKPATINTAATTLRQRGCLRCSEEVRI